LTKTLLSHRELVFLPVRVVNRKPVAMFITAILLITSIALFVTFSNELPTASPVSVTQKKGLTFIENVLPLDISQYNITLNQSRTEGYAIEIEQYTLESDESTLDVICSFENGILKICLVYAKNGSVISDRPYASINDAITSFLMKYQNYTHIDSTEMINMLSNVDPTKNTEITAGNLKLTISNGEFPKGTKTTSFNWKYVYNNCEYTGLNINFDNGTFAGLSDTRSLYTIGNTTVNVSMRQAIDAAMKYIENYSYKIAEDVWISDFNVTGTSAGLFSTVREPYVLYPYWQVKLFLDKTYPGSVDGLLVFIWADSGEAFDCSHFKYRWPPEY